MVVNDDLLVVFAIDNNSSSVITRISDLNRIKGASCLKNNAYIWIHINNFSIFFAFKEDSFFVVGQHCEIRRMVTVAFVGDPVVETEIGGTGNQFLCLIENGLKRF